MFRRNKLHAMLYNDGCLLQSNTSDKTGNSDSYQRMEEDYVVGGHGSIKMENECPGVRVHEDEPHLPFRYCLILHVNGDRTSTRIIHGRGPVGRHITEPALFDEGVASRQARPLLPRK